MEPQRTGLPADFESWLKEDTKPLGPRPALAEQVEELIRKYPPDEAAIRVIILIQSQPKSLREGEDK